MTDQPQPKTYINYDDETQTLHIHTPGRHIEITHVPYMEQILNSLPPKEKRQILGGLTVITTSL